MAFKKFNKLKGAMAPPAKKPEPDAADTAPDTANVVGTLHKPSLHKTASPKSSASTRDKWARAMNAGDRATADTLYAQMQAESAAARKAKR